MKHFDLWMKHIKVVIKYTQNAWIAYIKVGMIHKYVWMTHKGVAMTQRKNWMKDIFMWIILRKMRITHKYAFMTS